MTLFAMDKRLAIAETAAGECAYIPRNCGHSIQHIGTEECELVGVLDSNRCEEATLSDWMKRAPRDVLATIWDCPKTPFD